MEAVKGAAAGTVARPDDTSGDGAREARPLPLNGAMRTLGLRRCALAAAIVGLVAGCASAGSGRTEGPTVPVEVVVNNNLLLPTDITVYAVTESGHRTLLGSVPPQATRSFTFKPVSFSELYRLMATRALRRDVRSQVFSVVSDMTGRITWTMVPNIIGFEGPPADTSATTP